MRLVLGSFRLLVFYLNAGVFDFVFTRDALRIAHKCVRVGRRIGHQVNGHAVAAARDRPDMKIMHLAHAPKRGETVVKLTQVDSFGHAFEKNVQTLIEQCPRARQNPETDEHAKNRIDWQPAREFNYQGRNDHRDGAKHVAPNFQVCPFDVEALITAGAQHAHAGNINHETDDRDDEHPATGDFGGLAETPVRFVKNVYRDEEEHDGVEGGGQNFEAIISECAASIGGALTDANRRQRQSERRYIGEHVRGIGQQRETASEKPADYFSDKISSGKCERDLEPGSVRSSSTRRDVCVFRAHRFLISVTQLHRGTWRIAQTPPLVCWLPGSADAERVEQTLVDPAGRT